MRAEVPSVFEKKSSTVATIIGFAIASQLGIAASATTGEDIVRAIDKENTLGTSTRLNARVDGNTAKVSMYQDSRANDKDLKIDAVLISKTAMGIDPGITRVIVYFFNTKDMSHYKQTTVTTGTVKAFASGSIGKDELIASLPLEELENVDPNSKVESAMISGFSYRLKTTLEGNRIDISTELDPAASDRDLKYVALQIAEKALTAAPKTVSDVSIAFADPAQAGAFKQVSLNPKSISDLDGSLNTALAAISVTESKSESTKTPDKSESKSDATKTGSETHAIAGPLHAERQKLVDRITHLSKSHKDAAEPLLAEYLTIEKQLSEGVDETTLQDSVKQLTQKVEQAEKQKK